ncbi:MAG: ComEC/Rec2 family competence protein [Rickettsiales bacterium]|nr:ComEC/Rec2 family competence protein [Rickettsiales bacterium]
MRKRGVNYQDVLDCFYNDYSNWILWAPICFIIGVLLFFNFQFYNHFILILFFIFIPLIFVLKNGIYRIFVIIITTTLCGYVRSAVYTINLRSPILDENIRNSVITGSINDVSYYKQDDETHIRAVVEVKKIMSGEFSIIKIPKFARINVIKNNFSLKYGDLVRIRANIRPMPKQFFPNTYNPEVDFYYKQIGATAFNGVVLDKMTPDKVSLRDRFYNIRENINEKMIEGDSKNGAIIGSFITGIRGRIPADDYKSMTDAGLVHLIAISGMNMAITMGLIYKFIRRVFAESASITLKYDIKKIASVFAIIIGFLYLCITGFPASAVRAYIMSALFFIGVILERQSDIMRFLCFSALCILIINPSLTLDIGFQMSFLAVLILIRGFDLLKRIGFLFYTKKWYLKPFAYSYGVIVSAFIVSLGSMPLSIYHFNSYSFWTIIANIFAVPITTFFTIPLITLNVFLTPFGLEKFSVILTSLTIDAILWISKIVSEVHFIKSPTNIGLFFMLLGVLWLALWQEKWRFYGILILLNGVLFSIFQTRPDVYIYNNLIVYDNKKEKTCFSNIKSDFRARMIAQKLGYKNYAPLDKKYLINNLKIVYLKKDGWFVIEEY